VGNAKFFTEKLLLYQAKKALNHHNKKFRKPDKTRRLVFGPKIKKILFGTGASDIF
jgi:hypothetical protein